MAAGFLRTEFDNIPHKMHEKLTERNNLNKTSQQIKSAKDKLHRKDPTGVLQGGPGNMIEKSMKREIEQDMKPPGGGDDGPDGIQGMKEHAQALQKDLDTSDSNDDDTEFKDVLEKKPETVADVPKRDERTWGKFLGEITSFGGLKGKPNVTGGGGHEIKGPFSNVDPSTETLDPVLHITAKSGLKEDHKSKHKGLLNSDDPTRKESVVMTAQELAGTKNVQGPPSKLPYNHIDYMMAGPKERGYMKVQYELGSVKMNNPAKMDNLRKQQSLKKKHPNNPLYKPVPDYGT